MVSIKDAIGDQGDRWHDRAMPRPKYLRENGQWQVRDATPPRPRLPGNRNSKRVFVIVVQYLRRRNGSSRVIDSIEFRKDATGAFRHHIT
jgi:hypothetical protein